MTLKDKIHGEVNFFESIEKLEKIADEFAISFAEWIDTKYFQGEEKNKYHKSIKEYREGKFFNVKELLEIYKKEKGL